ncbi:hypothetical protein CC80DRAFT_580857 [Byssothecium circinans]|uniref:Protein kinase domain-containing protein n=1 Tax=Byssothecium circinans TaxID=147558 RepID=A0A6A5UIQ4_9PLEO|nr:hypothetical protein CC80DRAFT_580857 [Byssothecium circinans]
MTSPTTYTFFQISREDWDLTTTYILESSNGIFYHGTTPLTPSELSALPPSSIPTTLTFTFLSKQSLFHTFPFYDKHIMTKYTGSLTDPNVYIKRPSNFMSWPVDAWPTYNFNMSTRHEIAVGERIRRMPHKNLCGYMGVLVHPRLGAVTDIVYRRYTCDLFDFCTSGLLRTERQHTTIMRAIAEAVVHFNDVIGYGHNDIRPENIFLKLDRSLEDAKQAAKRGEAVKVLAAAVGDFDAAVPLGSAVLKHAPGEWWPMDLVPGLEKNGAIARREIDEAGVFLVGEFMDGWFGMRGLDDDGSPHSSPSYSAVEASVANKDADAEVAGTARDVVQQAAGPGRDQQEDWPFSLPAVRDFCHNMPESHGIVELPSVGDVFYDCSLSDYEEEEEDAFYEAPLSDEEKPVDDELDGIERSVTASAADIFAPFFRCITPTLSA